MAIILQSVAAGTTSVPVPAGTVNGDCLVLVISDWVNVAHPAGWTLIDDPLYNFQGEQAAFYRFASSEPASYTIGTGTTMCGVMARYTGVATSGTVQAAADTFGGNTAPSVSTTVADCLVVRTRVWANNSAITSGACAGYAVEETANAAGSTNKLWYADNSGLPSTSTGPSASVGTTQMMVAPGTVTTTHPASSASGSQGTALWTPTFSPGNGTATYLSFALTPA